VVQASVGNTRRLSVDAAATEFPLHGDALLIHSNGGAAWTVELSKGAHTITTRAYQHMRAGSEPARMEIVIDGVVASSFEVEPTSAHDFSFTTTFAQAGARTIEVRFTNDFFDFSEPQAKIDRNLFVEWVEVTAQVSEGAQCAIEAPGDACTRELVRALMARAWRRTPSEAELARFDALVTALVRDSGGDAIAVFEASIAAVLASPNTLYILERGEGEGAPGELTNFELATRLSIMLWGSIPDHELLAAAARGELHDDAMLLAQAERMLADPQAREHLKRSLLEHFGVDDLDFLTKDAELFPELTPALIESMRQEMTMLIEDSILDRRDLRHLFARRTSFVDARLARHYGLPTPEEDAFALVEFNPASERRGLLTTAGWLALNAKHHRTSAVLRGVYITGKLLCQPMGSPPDEIPSIEADPEDDETRHRTQRDLLQNVAGTTGPACIGCHARFEAVGLSLERFDAIGRWRADDGGLEIDTTGTFLWEPIEDHLDAIELLADESSLSSCLLRKLYTRGTGVGYSHLGWAFDDIGARLHEHGDLTEALLELVLHPGFRTIAPAQP